jgi:uncharacterized Rossmann fold enzyme
MDWSEWEPHYRAIVSEFGFDARADEEARDILGAFLQQRETRPGEVDRALRTAVEGRRATVVGAGHTVDGSAVREGSDFVVVADKAAAAFLASGGSPDAIVTDLDGDVWAILEANEQGVPVAVHAHGDNVDALRRWVPRMRGPLLGTTQAEPAPPNVLNVGGFTDGDRACFLAEHWGAASIRLVGFDFEHASTPRKLAKLKWARELVGLLRVPVEWR